MVEKKLESNFINMLGVLTLICALSAFLLSFTYTQTRDAIAAVRMKKQLKAIQAVTPPFDNRPNEEKYTVDNFEGIELFPAKKSGKRVGTAIKTFSSKGYGGMIWLMVGIDKDGRINETSVLQQHETPGLGTKMATQKFRKQFKGKSPDSYKLSVKKDGGDVDAITAATISSRAFCEAVHKACEAYTKGNIQ